MQKDELYENFERYELLSVFVVVFKLEVGRFVERKLGWFLLFVFCYFLELR